MNEIEKLCKEKTPKIFEDCKAGFFLICPHDSHRCAQLQEEEKQCRDYVYDVKDAIWR